MNPMFNQSNNILSQFEQFKASFTGNPKEEVQKLLDSGKMSQEMYERLSEQATQLQKLFGIF